MADERLPDRTRPPSLDPFIDDVINSGVTEVADVAVKVAQSAPPEVLEAHLLSMLRLAVRERMMRRSAANPLRRGAVAATRAERAITVRPASGRRAQQRSAFAEQRARWFADTVYNGERRVPLGDATAQDLIAAAGLLRQAAARTAASADRLDEITEALQRAGVEHVRDLPDAEIQRLINR